VSDWGGRDKLPENASPKLLEEEAIYQTRLGAAQAQMAHERSCPQCAAFAMPASSKERRGQPCIVGMIYWRVGRE
jgi:hypothetical protein